MMNLDMHAVLVEQVVSAALSEAEDLLSTDDTMTTIEARRISTEAFVAALQISDKQALALLMCCKVLPDPTQVGRVTPGMTPGYLAGVRKAAEMCLVQAALVQMEAQS